jgi:hypothetical protein
MLKAPEHAIGFKEWSLVCDQLAQGQQSLILRKGGIHEGRAGFHWQHQGFFLFPTWFHSQAEKLRQLPAGSPTQFAPEEERRQVDIKAFAQLEKVWKLTDWQQVSALEDLHGWTEEVVRERFVYDEESCLHVALVRVWRLPEVWSFDYQKSHGGCRSWVNLPPEGLGLLERAIPALDAPAWDALQHCLQQRLQS